MEISGLTRTVLESCSIHKKTFAKIALFYNQKARHSIDKLKFISILLAAGASNMEMECPTGQIFAKMIHKSLTFPLRCTSSTLGESISFSKIGSST